MYIYIYDQCVQGLPPVNNRGEQRSAISTVVLS